MSRARILIVEDETIIAMDIESILREYDYQVAGVVTSGEEALSAAEAQAPDLVLMDILLGGEMDGIEAARLIRRNFDIPIIYITANADEDTVQRARDTEPYAYINKPLNRKDLYSNIDSALYKHAMEKKLRAGEERYRDLVESINDVIFTLDTEGIFTYISPVIRRMGKYSEEEVIGRHFATFIHPDDLEGLYESVRRTAAGELEPYEYRLLDKDGRVVHVSTSSRPIMKNGVYSGMTGILTDITERRLSQAAIREREAKIDSILKAAPIGIGVTMDRIILVVNEHLCGMTGYSREELVGQSSLILFADKEEYERVGREKQAQIERTGTATLESRLRRRDGALIDVIISSSPIDPRNPSAGDSFTAMDITQRKQSEGAIREREARLGSILRAAPIGIGVVIDRVFVQVNELLCEMTGYARDDLIGQSALMLYPTREEYDFVGREKYAQIAERGIGTVETRWRRRDGAVIDVLLSSSPIEAGNLASGVTFTAMDITRRKKNEEAIRESEERFRSTFEGSFTPMALCDLKGRFLEVNEALCEMTGHSRRELLGRTYRAITYAGDLKHSARKLQLLLKGELDHFHLEQRYLHKNGSILWAVMSASLIHDTAGAPLYFSMQIVDITARKTAEGAVKKTQYLLAESQRMAGMGSIEFNSRTGEVYCTDETYRILGIEQEGRPLTAEEYLGLVHPEDAGMLRESFRECLKGDGKLDLMYRIVRPDGSVRHVKSLGNAVRERDGSAVTMIGTIMDITEQVRSEELIRHSLREKEIMLREIHHRVKNNFQFLISLLDIQSERLSDPGAIEAFSNARNRIRLISMVHEKLYQARDLSHIDISDYIRSLVDYLRQSVAAAPGKVSVSLKLRDVQLGINRAITCGLIINELVSNALKHAYPRGGGIKIRIEFYSSGEEYLLRIGDGGIGFPRGLDFRATESLGMQLVCMFVEQLGGSVELVRRRGTEFRISFPK